MIPLDGMAHVYLNNPTKTEKCKKLPKLPNNKLHEPCAEGTELRSSMQSI